MKIAIGVIIGIVLGVATNLISNFIAPYADRKRKLVWSIFIGVCALAIALALVPESTNPTIAPRVTVNKTKGAVLLKSGQAIVAANRNGVAIVRFIFTGTEASYQWRYWNKNDKTLTSGTGKLFENYAETPTATGYTIIDQGSALFAEIADLKIMWSTRGKGNGSDLGWIYFNYGSKEPEISFAVLNDQYFENLELQSIQYGD